MLPDDPMAAILTAVRARMSPVAVMGERPADLTEHLPVIVLSRVGGLAAGSAQDHLADRPLVAGDCYAMGLDSAAALAQALRRALRDMGGREATGPQARDDAQEAAGVRRINIVYRLVSR